MDSYEKAMKAMNDLFSRDYQFTLASVKDNVPSQRVVDTYFDGKDFYVVTYALSRKVKEIRCNPEVSICARKPYNFQCKAYDIGHPLKPENAAIRDQLIKVFAPWYFAHNNEGDENMCYVRLEPQTGFVFDDTTGYNVDFVNKTAQEFPFTFALQFCDD